MATKKKTPADSAPIEISTGASVIPMEARLALQEHGYELDLALVDQMALMFAEGGGGMGGFLTQTLLYPVVEAAKNVLVLEHLRGHREQAEVARARKAYSDIVTRVREALGADYEALLGARLAEQNAEARAELDGSDGRALSYVIPRFNDDGTHDAVGPRDFPWNREVL